MLGHKLYQEWQDHFETYATLSREFSFYQKYEIFERDSVFLNVRVEETETIARAVDKCRPAVIVNAIGLIKQRPTAADTVRTLQVNTVFPHQLAEVAASAGARLITISTDCVFDGRKGGYTEDDEPNASDLYGRSKHLGEVTDGNALTIRTSIIGRELSSRHGLVEWFLSNRGGRVKGFSNAVFSGFTTEAFAAILKDVIENQRSLRGLYHVSSNPINKYDLLCLIRDAFRADIEIDKHPDFNIDRSLDSARFRRETGFEPPDWSQMIEQLAADPTPYDNWK